MLMERVDNVKRQLNTDREVDSEVRVDTYVDDREGRHRQGYGMERGGFSLTGKVENDEQRGS